MNITTTKLSRGHYRIDREDGYSVEVRRSARGDWYQTSNMARFKSLSVAKFDMQYQYMPRDVLQRQEHLRQTAFERAMGMRGYRGSPAEREDRAAGIKPGGRVRYLCEPSDMTGTIVAVRIDDDGDPQFEIEFDAEYEHKNMIVEREGIKPL